MLWREMYMKRIYIDQMQILKNSSNDRLIIKLHQIPKCNITIRNKKKCAFCNYKMNAN